MKNWLGLGGSKILLNIKIQGSMKNLIYQIL